jgi:hypothetical protein
MVGELVELEILLGCKGQQDENRSMMRIKYILNTVM